MIRREDRDGVAVVTLDRPAKRNALGTDALDDLRTAVMRAGEETDAIVLTGAGGTFCAGADIDELRTMGEAEATEFASLGQSVADAIETANAPTIAAIDGPCLGGGVELALACDVRVAAPRSTFGEPGVRIGIFGGWGGTYRLPRLVGTGDAMSLALTGRTIDATTADGMGLVTELADDAEARAFALAREIAERRGAAVEAVRSAMHHGQRHGKDEALAHERTLFGALFGEDLNERIDEYMDR